MLPSTTGAVAAAAAAAMAVLVLLADGVGAYTGTSTPWLEQRVSTFLFNRDATVAAQMASSQDITLSDFLRRIGSGGPDSGEAAPIRVHIEYQLQDGITDLQEAYLKDKLLPATVAELQRHLKIRNPVAGPLLLARECARSAVLTDGSRHCMEASPQEFCGAPTLGILHNLTSFFGGYTLCSQDRTTCTDYMGGPGVEEADFILYVIAKDVECTDSSLAFAAPCELDLYSSRPLAGFINFCPSSISHDPGQFTNQLGTAVHEALHALGFTTPLFSLYSDASGSPWGFANVLKEEDGHFFVTTPTVVKQVRDHFQCPTLLGAKLEDEGASGTIGSHWDSRWFQGEIMDGSTDGSSSQNVFSPITLALMEDTGWYLGNWEAALPLEFGAAKGCQFLADCAAELTEGGLPVWDSYWCDEQMHDSGTQLCTWDNKGVGICDVDGLMNGCASPKPLNGRVCFQPEHSSPDFLWGTTQGPNVRCLHEVGPIVRSVQGQVLQKTAAGQAADCYAMQCDAEGRLLVSLAGTWAQCPSGETLDLSSHGYLQGSVGPCPDNAQMCAELACPAHCSGHGRCVEGKCRCHVGWAGPTCDRVVCSGGANSLSCPPQSVCDVATGVCAWGLPVPSDAEGDESLHPIVDWLTPVPTLPPVLNMTPYMTPLPQHVPSFPGAINGTWAPSPAPTEAYGLPFTWVTTAPAMSDASHDSPTGGKTHPTAPAAPFVRAPQGEADREVPFSLAPVVLSLTVTSPSPSPLSQQQLHGVGSVVAYLLGISAAAAQAREDVALPHGTTLVGSAVHYITVALTPQENHGSRAIMVARLEGLDIAANKDIFKACCSLELSVGSLEVSASSALAPGQLTPAEGGLPQPVELAGGSAGPPLEMILVIGGACLVIALLTSLLCTCTVLQLRALRLEEERATSRVVVPSREGKQILSGQATAPNPTLSTHNPPGASACNGPCQPASPRGSGDRVPLRASAAQRVTGGESCNLLPERRGPTGDGLAGRDRRVCRRGDQRGPAAAEPRAPAPPPAAARPAADSSGPGATRKPGGAARELRERLERLTELSHLRMGPAGQKMPANRNNSDGSAAPQGADRGGPAHLHDSGASLEAEEDNFLSRLAPSARESAQQSNSSRPGRRREQSSRDDWQSLRPLRERFTGQYEHHILDRTAS